MRGVSKDKLDAYWLSKGEHRQFCNDKAGLKSLVLWAERAAVARVIFEVTGVYQRLLEVALAKNAIPFARVNPRQARRFAEATGKIAQTDKVDAAVPARMGAVLLLEPQTPKAEYINVLRKLVTARRGLIKDRLTVKTRMQTTTQTLLKRHLRERLAQVEKHLEQVDQTIMDLLAKDEHLLTKYKILISIRRGRKCVDP